MATRLGPYEILGPIGVGGMGEVYKARDTRLGRTIAIKVLPPGVASDADRRRRFEQEARAASSLNHPHICTLHDIGSDDGVDFLVMELLEGQTLAERLRKGALPFTQALEYGAQIADALGAAHRRGIVHRDLKPANIMLTKSGAKLLDFGLAKLKPTATPILAATSVTAGVSALATQGPMTLPGIVLGTVPYMAPEQLECKETDARTDLFAFGAIVYEMVTGRRAFEGQSAASLIGAILEREPTPLAVCQPLAPAGLDRLVQRCLAKNADDRWDSAHDVADELRWISQPGGGLTTGIASKPNRLAWILVAALTIVSFAAVVTALFYSRTKAAPARDVRYEIAVPNMPNSFAFALSPDGRHLAYAARADDEKTMLWVRSLNAVKAHILPGTEDAVHPFWSPDSRSIGFSVPDGQLKRIEVTGGPVQTLVNFGGTSFRGTWNRDGVIVFANGDALQRVAASGGQATEVTQLDSTLEETSHLWPWFLPDGRHFLYLAQSRKREHQAIYIGSLDAKTRTRLMPAESMAVYTPPGFILFLRDRTLMARPFDAARLEFTGDAFPIAEGVSFAEVTGRAAFAASDEGTLVYRMGIASPAQQLLWLDRTGKVLSSTTPGLMITPGLISGVIPSQLRLSPDGKRVVLTAIARAGEATDLWIYDFERNVKTRLTTDPGTDHLPVWSPDGSRVVFDSDRSKRPGHVLYEKPSNGATPEQVLLEPEPGVGVNALDWSLDGRWLVYGKHKTLPESPGDIWVLPRVGDQKPFPYLETPFDKSEASLSPNARWIAYTSNESGTDQVYVQSFPNKPGGKWQVSTEGGAHPRWKRDGSELYYCDPNGQIVAVAVKTDRGFELGGSSPLFRIVLAYSYKAIRGGPAFPYDVTADGQRFLVGVPFNAANQEPLTVVLNWLSAIGR